MLVLSRRSGEKIRIGNEVTLTVVSVQGNRVKLAFSAPDNVRILRSEVAFDSEPELAACAGREGGRS
jgi:carbon storage regulator